MHMAFTVPLLVRAGIARSIIVLGWHTGHKIPRVRFSEKKPPDFFELHRTSVTSMGSVAAGIYAYGLYGTFTSHISVCKVN